MKKVYIAAIILIAGGIVLLSGIAKDASTYATFEDARNLGTRVKVAGQLSKNKEMVYDPEIDPNYFSFYIKDAKGEENKVILAQAKPQDFEMSEQIVVTGSMQGNEFVATDMLMKCPSKYKDEEIYIKEEQGK